MMAKGSFKDEPDIWKSHLNHYIDTVRQALICYADVATVPVEWPDIKRRIIPEFETIYTCREVTTPTSRECSLQRIPLRAESRGGLRL